MSSRFSKIANVLLQETEAVINHGFPEGTLVERYTVSGLEDLTLTDALQIAGHWFQSQTLHKGQPAVSRSGHLMIQPQGTSPEGIEWASFSAFNLALDYLERND